MAANSGSGWRSAAAHDKGRLTGWVIGQNTPLVISGDVSPVIMRQYHATSDHYQVYSYIFDHRRHHIDKTQGETNHVERWFNTMRQRFTRKTLALSKQHACHEGLLHLFILDYNCLVSVNVPPLPINPPSNITSTHPSAQTAPMQCSAVGLLDTKTIEYSGEHEKNHESKKTQLQPTIEV